MFFCAIAAGEQQPDVRAVVADEISPETSISGLSGVGRSHRRARLCAAAISPGSDGSLSASTFTCGSSEAEEL